MKTALRILKRDLLALLKNPIALLVVGALLVLPGLYAWYCIIANWDPYANTGSMPIAVMNLDEGAKSDLAGEVDIGGQVVEKLHDNDSIDWRFYDSEEEALADTRLAVCYATLVFPEDLSANVLGILDGSGEKPTIYYYPNEKYNAVASKVTDSATQTLVRQINQNFSSTVNETILESAQKAADEVEERAGKTNAGAIEEIRSVQADIDQVVASLNDAVSSIDAWRDAAHGADAALAGTAEQLPQVRSMLEKGSGQLDSLRSKTGDFESELSSTVLNSASTVSGLSAQTVKTLSQAVEDLAVVQERLEAISDSAGSDEDLKALVDLIDTITGVIKGIVSQVDERVASVDAKVQDATSSVSKATRRISGEVMPELGAGTYGLSTSLSKLSGAVGQFEPQVTQLRDVLAQTDVALDSAIVAIADAKGLLLTIGANLKGTVSDIGAIGRAVEIDKLTELLEVDPDNVGTFVSSPVHMVTQEVYPVSNYGTAVAPFYTNLALWIGCFILVSLMKVEVDSAGFERATSRQRYFGRWLLFVILSLLQSQVICGVDILLGIDCANPAAFMAAGAVCSFAYMNLIFALVKTFRNIGKTLCIFLLIMQVPGSSGMYPIQMMPGFFQFIHPALPFTYGIDAMREALSGMYGMAYAADLALLLLIVPASLLLGLAVRPLMANLLLLFDEEMRKTGFFASEEHGQEGESARLRGMMRALMVQSANRDDIEERAWRFRRLYPRVKRVGSIATFAIPFVFLVLMLPLNVFAGIDTDAKLSALVFMLAVLLLVLFGLIVLEYMNRLIAEETKLIGDDLLADFDLEGLGVEAGADAGAGSDVAAAASSDAAPVLASAPAADTAAFAADDAADAAAGVADAAGAGSLFVPVVAGDASASAGAEPAGKLAAEARRGPARDIFLTDMRLGFQSAIGVVVIMLLVVTPSMYAWFNIAGSWDPYSSTGNLKVAVANEDAGYKGELIPVTINIGDTLVSQLRGNTSFNWVFVDKDEAISGVESSKYYAAIEIPSDFSRNMMTYLTDDADYPDVVYYTNEKENPIAPIITQKGADSIQESIRVSFTERVDEVALSVAYDVLNYVTNPRMSSYVVTMSKHLDDAMGDTRSAAREIRSLSGLTGTVASIVATTGTTLEGVRAAGESAKGAIGDAKAGAASASEALDAAVAVAKEMVGDRKVDVGKIQEILDIATGLLEAGAEGIPERIDRVIERAEELRDENPDVPADKFDALIDSLKAARKNAAAVPGKISDANADTKKLIRSAQGELDDVKVYFDGTVQPSVEDLRGTLRDISSSTSGIVGGLEGAIDGVGDSTGGLTNQLSSLSGGLSDAAGKLEKAAGTIEDTKQRVADAIQSGDVKKIEAVVLGSDPEAMAASLAEPVSSQREAVYSVANYGSAMAPFYTVLSLWVGALVMISTMRVRVAEERIEELRERYAKVRPRHEFFGRYGIFGVIGLLQSSLVLLGDLLFLHIECANPVLFFVFGVFIGQVFCLVVFTLTELFGDVGKALCVILLIMQVAASGGTFPVEMLHPILSSIVPFLPFYHAMSLLQECVAGVYWPAVAMFCAALLVIAGAALIVGIPLRRPFRKLNDFFEEQLEKTGYM